MCIAGTKLFMQPMLARTPKASHEYVAERSDELQVGPATQRTAAAQKQNRAAAKATLSNLENRSFERAQLQPRHSIRK
jgi:hypothetical protein